MIQQHLIKQHLKINKLSIEHNKPNSDVNIYVTDMAEKQNHPLSTIVKGYPTYLYLDPTGQVHELGNHVEMSSLLNKQENDGTLDNDQKKHLIGIINEVMNT